MSTSTTPYVRGFRLHLSHGQVLDGAQFPNGKVFVMDDPEWGLGTGARSAELLQIGYPDSRIEWADQTPAEHCGHQPPEVFTWRHPGQYGECVLRPGHSGSHADEHGMRWWLANQPAEEQQGPPETPCTDPRHTGPIREQLGCTGPDPAHDTDDQEQQS